MSATVSDEGGLARWLVAQPTGRDAFARIIRGEAGARPDVEILEPSDRIPWAGHSGRHALGDADALVKIIKEHIETPMAGRTHLQHALPVSFGYKAATWLSGIDRHIKRLEEIKSRIFNLSFFGAAGTLASLGEENGLNTQIALANELGLNVPDVSWHSIRDNFCEVTGWLAIVGASLGKIAYDVMLMMQTEIQEVAEPFLHGRGSSSTMPQKRNPISSEIMLACSKLLREHHSSMLDAMVLDHERATGQWHVEWNVIPNSFIIASSSFKSARFLLEGLEVSPENMKKNIDKTNGLIVAEAVMMALAPHIGRQVAHDIVYDCCRQTIKNNIPFVVSLLADKNISKIFNENDLLEIVNPSNYLGAAPAMANKLLKNR